MVGKLKIIPKTFDNIEMADHTVQLKNFCHRILESKKFYHKAQELYRSCIKSSHCEFQLRSSMKLSQCRMANGNLEGSDFERIVD